MKIILLLLFPLILHAQIGPENDMMEMEQGEDIITWIKSLSKSKSMENFDADQARAIVEDLSQNELLHVLKAIKIKAEKEEMWMHVYKPLKQETIEQLKAKGFTVKRSEEWGNKNANLYYTICW